MPKRLGSLKTGNLVISFSRTLLHGDSFLSKEDVN